MADQSKEFLQRLLTTFRSEAQEHLQEITAAIVQLEQSLPAEQASWVDRILKRLHTLKGAARAVNLVEMEALCHAMESVFSAINKAAHPISAADFDMLHQAAAMAQNLVQPPSGRVKNQAVVLTSRMSQMADQIRQAAKRSAQMPEQTAPLAPPAAAQPLPVAAETVQASAVPEQAQMVRVQSACLDAIRYQVEALLEHELSLQHQADSLIELANALAEQAAQRQGIAGSGRLEHSAGEGAPGAGTPAAGKQDPTYPAKEITADRLPERCRQLADSLVTTRRKLGAARNRLMAAALETALVPFSSAFAQLPVMVRNLARKQGKDVTLKMTGEGTLVDRRVLEIAAEVLIHLVTNAVDHGIESPEQRQSAGKPATGTVSIEVRQSSGSEITVSVADDGAGINIQSLVQAAVRNGALDAGQIKGLDDEQALRLALHTGVSTSTRLTEVSGRGVGLAIVADKVGAIGGELRIDNVPGRGCTFHLGLPVRLTSLRALLFSVYGQRFLLPLTGLRHVQKVRPDQLQTIENRETLRFGGKTLATIRLGKLLQLAEPAASQDRTECIAVVVSAGSQLFALLIDEIQAEQEVLPKPLGKLLRRVRFFSGAARLGDGALVPVLALDDIARHGLHASAMQAQKEPASSSRKENKRILVVEDSVTSRLLLKHILEGAGYRVDTANDGLDALSRLRQQTFDAVVSDIEMPRMDGLTLTSQIRASAATAALPVVLVTTLQSAQEKERGLQAGADAYVVKGSFDQDNLLETLRRLI